MIILDLADIKKQLSIISSDVRRRLNEDPENCGDYYLLDLCNLYYSDYIAFFSTRNSKIDMPDAQAKLTFLQVIDEVLQQITP